MYFNGLYAQNGTKLITGFSLTKIHNSNFELSLTSLVNFISLFHINFMKGKRISIEHWVTIYPSTSRLNIKLNVTMAFLQDTVWKSVHNSYSSTEVKSSPQKTQLCWYPGLIHHISKTIWELTCKSHRWLSTFLREHWVWYILFYRI